MAKRQLLDAWAGQLYCLAELNCLMIHELEAALPNIAAF